MLFAVDEVDHLGVRDVFFDFKLHQRQGGKGNKRADKRVSARSARVGLAQDLVMRHASTADGQSPFVILKRFSSIEQTFDLDLVAPLFEDLVIIQFVIAESGCLVGLQGLGGFGQSIVDVGEVDSKHFFQDFRFRQDKSAGVQDFLVVRIAGLLRKRLLDKRVDFVIGVVQLTDLVIQSEHFQIVLIAETGLSGVLHQR